MSKIDELLAQFCPNGVKCVELGSVCRFQNGFAFKSSKFKNDGKPIIRIGNIVDGLISNNGYVYFNENDYSENLTPYMVCKGDIVIAMSGATTGKIGINTSDQIYYLNQRVGLFLPNEEYINKKYLYYWLLSKTDEIYNISSGTGAQPNLSSQKMMRFIISLPPVEIQIEIIKILDNYTMSVKLLQQELRKELTARKQQYLYYLNRFFENSNSEIVPLASLGTLTRGKRFVHADVTDEGVPCIHYGELYTYYGVFAYEARSHIREDLRSKMRYATKGDVIIVGAGENKDDIGVGVAWYGDEDVAVHDACYMLSHKQNPKYISYFLRSNIYHQQIVKYVYEGKICSISAENVGKALIPIPPIEEQNRIVSTLDRFDKLCTDLSFGLPAEIEARRKQYEYYRDKLLSFNEP